MGVTRTWCTERECSRTGAETLSCRDEGTTSGVFSETVDSPLSVDWGVPGKVEPLP